MCVCTRVYHGECMCEKLRTSCPTHVWIHFTFNQIAPRLSRLCPASEFWITIHKSTLSGCDYWAAFLLLWVSLLSVNMQLVRRGKHGLPAFHDTHQHTSLPYQQSSAESSWRLKNNNKNPTAMFKLSSSEQVTFVSWSNTCAVMKCTRGPPFLSEWLPHDTCC